MKEVSSKSENFDKCDTKNINCNTIQFISISYTWQNNVSLLVLKILAYVFFVSELIYI